MSWFACILIYIGLVAFLSSNVLALAWSLFLQLSLLAGLILFGIAAYHARKDKGAEDSSAGPTDE